MANADGNIKTDQEDTTVFFSYSRVDQEEALSIIAAIEAAGFRVWWDGMLEGGTSYLETTEHALETAKAVVVLWSQTSVTSHWVRDEAMSGRVRDRLIPLSMDGTTPPLGFRQVQLIDFTQWGGETNTPVFLELRRVLESLHGKSSNIGVQAATPFTITPKRKISRRSLVLGGGAAAALAGIGGFSISSVLSGDGKLAKNGIVVMPFKNLSGDSGLDYMSTGMSSEIRNSLASNSILQVVANSSSNAIAKLDLSAGEIASKLGVANIVEGSITKDGNLLKVSTELIDGKTGFSRWIKNFQNTLDDVLSIKNQITEAVSQALTDQVSTGGPQNKDGGTENAAAFNEYLKGRDQFLKSNSRETTLLAMEHFSAAINYDGDFSAAHAAKARVFLWLGSSSSDVETTSSYFKSAVTAAEYAAKVSPDFADAHSTLGYVLFSAQLNIEGARAPFERSYELGKGNSPILARYASYMAMTKQDSKSIPAIKRALELDPLNFSIHRHASLIYYAAGRYDDTIAAGKRALAINPKQYNTNSYIGLAQIYAGNIEQGLVACSDERNPMEHLPCMAIGLFKTDNPEAAQTSYDELIDKYGDAGAYQQVQVLAQWGRLDDAMAVMQKAYSLGDSGLSLAQIDPALNPLRKRPDFITLLAEIGFSG